MKMQESGQDYLESILILSQSREKVRASDICRYFDYSRPTVSVFIKQLKENGYVEVDSQKNISLTEKGMAIASEMYERHQFLTKFFISIGVPEDIAAKDACRVEHYVSAETYQAMKNKFQG